MSCIFLCRLFIIGVFKYVSILIHTVGLQITDYKVFQNYYEDQR